MLKIREDIQKAISSLMSLMLPNNNIANTCITNIFISVFQGKNITS